jgi:hypothetical protein
METVMIVNNDFGVQAYYLAQSIQEAALGDAPAHTKRETVIRDIRDAAAAALEEAAGYQSPEYYDAAIAYGKYLAMSALYLQITGDDLSWMDPEIKALEAEYFGFAED